MLIGKCQTQNQLFPRPPEKHVAVLEENKEEVSSAENCEKVGILKRGVEIHYKEEGKERCILSSSFLREAEQEPDIPGDPFHSPPRDGQGGR